MKITKHYVASAKIGRDGLIDASEGRRQRGDAVLVSMGRSGRAHGVSRCSTSGRLYFAFRVEDDDVVLIGTSGTGRRGLRGSRGAVFATRRSWRNTSAWKWIRSAGPRLSGCAFASSTSWTVPGLKVAGRQTGDGYAVDGMIPLASLKSLGFPSPGPACSIQFGIYRAEFRHGEKAAVEGWISWVDPRTKEPDFHVPESFGRLKMIR